MYMYVGIHVLKCLKEELVLATDKWLRTVSNFQNSYTTKELKYKSRY